MTDKPSPPPAGRTWRHAALLTVVLGSLVGMLCLDPIAQDPEYHAFADTRSFLGIPNFLDVMSNLPFLFVGFLGVAFCRRANLGAVRNAWTVFFVGVGVVSIGSAYYHWSPTNDTLVWDRLPMTIAFMGLFVALLAEQVGNRLAVLLVPAVLIGLGTVVLWHLTDDLRLYFWVQLVPLITIPLVLVLFRGGYSHEWVLLVALLWYVLAKVTEATDCAIFSGTGEVVSGHSIKHVFAAVGSYCVLWMLQKRKRLD